MVLVEDKGKVISLIYIVGIDSGMAAELQKGWPPSTQTQVTAGRLPVLL